MKVKNRKILIFICAIILLLSSICTNLGIISSDVYAATEDIDISENENSEENEMVSNKETIIDKTEESENSNIDTNEIIEESTEENIVDSSIENYNIEELLNNEDLLISENSGNMSLAASGENSTIQYYGSVSYGGSKVGNFAVNGKQAFCVEHAKKSPPTGTPVIATTFDNINMSKCLYYRLER